MGTKWAQHSNKHSGVLREAEGSRTPSSTVSDACGRHRCSPGHCLALFGRPSCASRWCDTPHAITLADLLRKALCNFAPRDQTQLQAQDNVQQPAMPVSAYAALPSRTEEHMETSQKKSESLYTEADFYDKFTQCANPPTSTELIFYGEIATFCDAPVLELGCGTGRLSVPLASLGHAVAGLDSSDQMLAVAREKARTHGVNVDYIQADLRTFRAEARFGLVISSYNFLSHMHTCQELRSSLDAVRASLMAGGFFVIDQENPSPNCRARDPRDRISMGSYREETGDMVEAFHSCWFDEVADIFRRTMYLKRAGIEVERSLDSRLWSSVELDAVLSESGFRVFRKMADFNGTPFTQEAERQLLFCTT